MTFVLDLPVTEKGFLSGPNINVVIVKGGW